jgi:hypothetical protein
MADRGADIRERAGDLARDVAGAKRDLIELGGLLLEHGAQIGVDLVDRADARLHIAERIRRALNGLLDVLHLLGDVPGRLRGLAGELLYAARHHGEAQPRIARAHRLDAGVERQKRGLPGDGLDEGHHLVDTLRGMGKAAHRLVGGSEIVDGAIACNARCADIAGRPLDAHEDAAGGGGDGIDVVRGGLGRVGSGRDPDMHMAVPLGEIGGGVADAAAAVGEGAGDLIHR